MRICLRILAISLFAIGVERAAGAQNFAGPATAPASDQIDALIAQLGDADYHVRRDASERLRQIGPPAVPALKRAMENPQPEVRLRAEQIVRSFERRRVPGRPHGHARVSAVTMGLAQGRRTIEVDDEGRHIRISQGPGGIEMTVTGELDGRPATETFKAKSPDQLKAQNPEAYALFERFTGGVAMDMRGNIIHGGLIFRQGIAARPLLPMLRAGGDDLLALRDKLDQQIRQAKLTPEQRRQVDDALSTLDLARKFVAAAQLDNPDQEMKRYNDASDKLRQALRDLKLPDPGDVLPPPQNARLGISAPEAGVDGGVIVSHVMPDSRAQHIGLREDDVIRKVNGSDVHNVRELRRLVTEHPRDLVVEITRNGEDLTLREK